MSAGERLDEAHKTAAPAMGALVTMIVLRRGLTPQRLEWIASRLEAAAATIRSVLTDNQRGV